MNKKTAIAQARSEIYSKTPKENFLAIDFDYGKSIVLPYNEGLQFLSCLKNAELLTDQYSKPKTITAFESNYFKTRILSRKEYEDMKIAALLGITVEELYSEEKKEETA
jgi:hypothetical protein